MLLHLNKTMRTRDFLITPLGEQRLKCPQFCCQSIIMNNNKTCERDSFVKSYVNTELKLSGISINIQQTKSLCEFEINSCTLGKSKYKKEFHLFDCQEVFELYIYSRDKFYSVILYLILFYYSVQRPLLSSLMSNSLSEI